MGRPKTAAMPAARAKRGRGSRPRARGWLYLVTRETTVAVLTATGGNRAKAAKALGVCPRTLDNLLRRYRLVSRVSRELVPAGGGGAASAAAPSPFAAPPSEELLAWPPRAYTQGVGALPGGVA